MGLICLRFADEKVGTRIQAQVNVTPKPILFPQIVLVLAKCRYV
jgi:hypothetical protein